MTFKLQLQNDAGTVTVDLTKLGASVSRTFLNSGAIPIQLPPDNTGATNNQGQKVFDLSLVADTININCTLKDGVGRWRIGTGDSISSVQAYTNAEKLMYFAKYKKAGQNYASQVYLRWGDDAYQTTRFAVTISNLSITNEPGQKDLLQVSMTMFVHDP
jgi:hypothetical protein